MIRRAGRSLAGWGRDHELRRRAGHVGHLLAGNFAASFLALAAVAIAARALGAYEYGVLAMIIAFARVVERLVSFQSWRPIIKYGAELDPGDPALASLMKLGLLLDLAAAAAAWVLAVAATLAAAIWCGWHERTQSLVLMYCTVLLFNLGGLPIAALRLAGRFRAASYGQVASGAARLLLSMGAAVAGADLWTFALIWMGTQILASLALLGTGVAQLRRQGVRGLLRAPLVGVGARFPGFWRFTWSVNLSLTLRSSANQLDTLFVGALAGPAGAGLYNLAKQIGKMAQTVGTQVESVLYPDITRLWAARAVGAFRRAVLQVEVLLGIFGLCGVLVVAAVGEPLLRLLAGAQFAAAAPLLLVQAIAAVLMIGGSAVHTALLAMGRAKEVLRVATLGTIAFHATLLLLVPRIGPMGANVAHVVLGAISILGFGLALRRSLRATADKAATLSINVAKSA